MQISLRPCLNMLESLIIDKLVAGLRKEIKQESFLITINISITSLSE